MNKIVCKDISKSFKLSRKQIRLNDTNETVKEAVKSVSFEVAQGSIFGLLGPNGAGKTTIQRMLATLISPDEGEIFVDGFSVKDDGEEVRKRICFLTGEMQLDKDLTPNYLFLFYGRLHGLSDDQIKARRVELFNELEINKYCEVKCGDLSTGMKQKVSIAISLIHDPDIIIYDEPTNGLDIIAANNIVKYLRNLKSQGKTIIVSTHILSLIEEICDTVAILINGSIVYNGSMSEVLESNSNLSKLFFDLYEVNK